ncbi:MAG: three-Cys-motif partner protein TcmP [Thermoflexibacter sp.]|jgi:three-Cys-motif partner protein|nr:three-Cys-motif partner protein TcmP [Thermoflexibacter sp.]
MNEFGDTWTQEKIEVFMKYVPAYLKIMHAQITKHDYAKNWKLMYFDGFAGSGGILQGSEQKFIEGIATRVLAIDDPRSFDLYYFVEFDKHNAELLTKFIQSHFLDKNAHVANADFNTKIIDFEKFLRAKGKNYKVLSLIDPYGMSVKWSSIEILKNLSIDMWILVPTGIGVNRLLKNDGEINDSWLNKLKNFLGLSEQEIKETFYKTEKTTTLFGEETRIRKEEEAIEKAHQLYKTKLKTIFKYVSDSFVMRNSNNSILYHFLLVSNNEPAVKIANDIIDKKQGITKLQKWHSQA